MKVPDDAFGAAQKAAAFWGLSGEMIFLGESMATVFALDTTVLRVTPFGEQVNMEVIAAFGQLTAPVRFEPYVSAGSVWVVEAYSRLFASRPTTPEDLGVALARLHTTAAPPDTPPNSRLAVAWDRLSFVEDSILQREFAERLHIVQSALSHSAPVGLVHSDPSLSNLIVTDKGSRWIDLQYSGNGACVLDVAFLAGELYRFGANPQRALGAYYAAGGVVPLDSLQQFVGVRELLGAIDIVALRPAALRQIAIRLKCMRQPGSPDLWIPLAALSVT